MKKNKSIWSGFLLALIFIFFPLGNNAKAGILSMWTGNVFSSSDNAEKFNIMSYHNLLFLGATVGVNQHFALGQSLGLRSQSHKEGSGETSTLSVMELGPRALLYFGENRIFALSIAWHPYAKGSRKMSTAASVSEKISGSSYLAGMHIHMKATKVFAVGFSLMYYMLSINESIVDNTKSTVSHSYSNYYPAIDLVLRF